MLKNVMNGLPDEVPHLYDLASAPSHVTSDDPPTWRVHCGGPACRWSTWNCPGPTTNAPPSPR